MHSGEGKIDLRIELKLFSFFIYLLSLSNFLFAQIPINGFTNFSEVATITGQNKLISLNYNKDPHSDILIYSNDNNTAFLITGQPNLKFTKPLKLSFRFEPNFFKPVYNSQNQITEYAFTSRKSRLFGLMNFNQYGYPRISKTLKLNSFPNKIDIADIDLDNSNDYLVSGEAFEGLLIISEENNRLVEKKLFRNHSFLDAFFFDINGDEYIDILAYDLISQKLFFIYNKDGDRFDLERELYLNRKIYKFQSLDINLDGFKDLIFSTDNGLIIYLGDNLNVFNQFINIKTTSSISNFVVGDFNHDGNFDFICHSSASNYLSIIFSKDGNEFFEEIIFDFGSQISEIIPFFSRFVYGVAYLKDDGKINIVSEFSSFNKDVNFIFGIKPTEIKTFDFNNNGLSDFIFIDKFDNKLKIILRNNRGIPSQFFQVELKGVHSEIFILRKSIFEVIIYCYSINQRLIEIVEVDFRNFNFKKELLYAEGKIQDLWSVNKNGVGEIKILFSKEKELNYGVIKLSLDKKYNLIKYPLVSDNFNSTNILSENEDKILYWIYTDTTSFAYSVDYLFDTKQSKRIYSDYAKGIIRIFTNISKKVKNYDYFSSLIETSDKKYLLIFSPDFNILKKSDLLTNHSLKYEKPLISDNEGFLYFFDSKLNQIFRIVYVKRLNRVIIRPIYQDVKVSEFVVSKLDKKNKHLIYIDSEVQKIKTRQLD